MTFQVCLAFFVCCVNASQHSPRCAHFQKHCTFQSIGCLCCCRWLLFVCYICTFLCLHGGNAVLVHLIWSIVWFAADGCLLPEDCDSWRKLKLSSEDTMGKGGKTRAVITIKPRKREHPSASFPLLHMWHRYKMSPRLICRAVHTLNKFIFKLAVKQNELFCL